MNDLTQRQRTAPPVDRWSARRQESAGGYDTTSPRTLAPGIEDNRERFPGDWFDTEIIRDRGPHYQRPMYLPPPITWISWTAAGPVRPELHVRNATLRTLVGNTMSRYPVINSPTSGMHTMGPSGVARTVQRYVETPQMTGARINRLSPGQYSGQTYSQTTRLQGGGRR